MPKYRSEAKPKIYISAKDHGESYLFIVKDNGIGIEKQHLDRIFTIFQRLNSREEYEEQELALQFQKKLYSNTTEKYGQNLNLEMEQPSNSQFQNKNYLSY